MGQVVKLVFILTLIQWMTACSERHPSACDNLVYKEEGLTRTEFLPCAGEMLATMGKLDAKMDAVLKGDKSARAEASEYYAELGNLIRKAGGRNMLKRWRDEDLNRLNLQIWNAYGGYQAALMFPNDTDANAARGSKDEARSIYESLR